MRRIKELIEYLDKTVTNTLIIKQTLKHMQEQESQMPEGCKISANEYGIIIKIKDFNQLESVLQWLRVCFGNIEYQRSLIWYNKGKMICSWEIDGYLTEIWLETPPEDFPKELQSDKCKVVELDPIVEKQYAYVCTEAKNDNS